MPIVTDPGRPPTRHGPGWTELDWASSEAFGTSVAMTARRCRIDPGMTGPPITLAATEALVYVIAGSGSAASDGEMFPLTGESMLWLAGCDDVVLAAAADGLDALVAETTGDRRAAEVLRKLYSAGELPHLVSTRDTRDRLDLVTEEVSVGARGIRADRIVYHPGDTAAAHYHTDAHHVFCVLTGSGLLHGDVAGESARLVAGVSALVGPGEVHWFENDREEEFAFVEFWAPPPTETVWTVANDRCTWAPAAAGTEPPRPPMA